ncbi:uncharacterized protein LOC125646489 isoform X2 [Ostrea edulis]|uniref:uncharacterized protein LOC125646489 isoform X2 n=1 Tax=Ostrea edulis TaxID=37623 RepID=UPI0024AF0F79|nr:uncharacterized protein LOC125646489 isoform X2 [Ostrea edulis]
MKIVVDYVTWFLIVSVLTSVTESCNYMPYHDIRCYVENVNGQYLLRPCPPGDYINPKTCRLETIPHNMHISYSEKCTQTLSGSGIYITWHEAHSHGASVTTTTKSTPSSSTASVHVDHHSKCYQGHSYYRGIFDNAEKENCHTSYSVFDKLYYLMYNDHDCMSTLVQVMANLNLPSCECHGSSISYPYRGSSSRYDDCIRETVYQDVLDTYLTHQPHHVSGTGVYCQSRHKLWGDLFRLQSASSAHCSNDFIYQMKTAYDMNASPTCSACHTVGTHNQVTSSPNQQHFTKPEKYAAYKKGECLSEHTVWSFLYYETGYPNGLSRESVIQEMAALFPNGTDDTCVCTKNKDLHFVSLGHQDYVQSCSTYNSDYRGAISHLLDHMNSVNSSPQTCHSHTAIWLELNHIAKSSYGEGCIQDLIHHLYTSVQRQGYPCTCQTASITSSSTARTSTTPQPTTTPQLTTTMITSSPNQQHLTRPERYAAYKKGECLSEHTVWSFLYYETGYHNGLRRESVIQEMAALFPNGTDDTCVCTKNKDMHFVSLGHQDYANSCSTYNSDYRGAISHLLDHMNSVHSSPQTCHSHTAIWQELNQIAKHNYGTSCVQDLIHHLYASVHQQGDPCTCQSASITSPSTARTSTTPQPTTISPLTPQPTTLQPTTTAQPTTTSPPTLQPTATPPLTPQPTTTLQPTTTPQPTTTISITSTPSTTVKINTSTKMTISNISTSPSATPTTSQTSGTFVTLFLVHNIGNQAQG